MIKAIAIAINIVLTSLYFFPFTFKAFPIANTKMMMAVVGLAVFCYKMSQGHGRISKNLFNLSLYAIAVSIFGFLSVTINETPDYAYAAYIMSMWVWIGGAYALCNFIKSTHGKIDITLCCNYLAAVSVLQCGIALLIDDNAAVKTFVDGLIEQGQKFLNESNVRRLYGIGASLDVAGARFSAVLIILAVCIVNAFKKNRKAIVLTLYLAAFAFIGTVGNFIARTTTIGLGIAILYWIFDSKILTGHVKAHYKNFLISIIATLVVTIPTLVYLYNTDPVMNHNLRFGFEGFFSLFEKGEWEVASNTKLKTMYVFPNNIKTWIIGDGYFSNPIDVDPFFTGKIQGGYYMGTDVGYLRFIFYFGLLGLISFMAFILRATKLCIEQFKNYKAMFILLMLINFIIWFKVSTDIFLVFAIFLMFPADDKSEIETVRL